MKHDVERVDDSVYRLSPGDFVMAELLAQLPMSPHMSIISPPTTFSPMVMSPVQHSGAGSSGSMI